MRPARRPVTRNARADGDEDRGDGKGCGSMSVESPLWTRAEAAKYLRISLRSFARLRIEGIRYGDPEKRGRVFYTKEILDEWLRARMPASVSAPPAVERSPTTPTPRKVEGRSPWPSRPILTDRQRRRADELDRIGRSPPLKGTTR